MRHIRLLLIHAQNVRQRRRLSEMKPRLGMDIESKVAPIQEVARRETAQRRRLEVIVSLPATYRLLHQHRAAHHVRSGHAIQAHRVPWHRHPRLDHHERAQRREEAVGIEIAVREARLRLELPAVQDRAAGVHVDEEEIDARGDEFGSEQARRGRETRSA